MDVFPDSHDEFVERGLLGNVDIGLGLGAFGEVSFGDLDLALALRDVLHRQMALGGSQYADGVVTARIVVIYRIP